MEKLTPDQYHDYSWEVIDKYFKYNKGYQLVKHQLESFNDFLLTKLEQIIDGFNTIEIHHQYVPEIDNFKYLMRIDIKNPILNKPTIFEKDGSMKIMTPNDARQRNFTYSSNVTVDMHILTKTLEEDGNYSTESKQINNISLGKIPIMVKSNYCVLKDKYIDNGSECRYDFGGYFIVNGNEKTIICQDRIQENKTCVFTNNKISTYSHVAEIRSVQENKLGVPKITSLKLSAKANQFGRYIRANIHHIKTDIPVFILFKALGLENDKEIIKYIVYDLDKPNNKIIINQLIGCIEEANTVTCQRDALEYLSKYLNITGYPKEILNNKIHRLNIIRNVLENEFLPHVGTSFEKKALYLGFMVNKLIKCFLGLKEFDDRDSYINKRIDTPGILMANLFRQYYGKMIKDMKNMIQKEINTGGWRATNKFINVINKINVNNKIVKQSIIDSGMRYALATGNWGIKNNKNKQGVAQVLNRMTYNSTISHLRRATTTIDKSGKLIQPRKLNPTQLGIICPAECFDPDTPILSWNGDIKKAKDIEVGEYLIDDKGNRTIVKSTCSGYKTMYEVIPNKRNFMSHTVTDNHILTLKIRDYKKVRTHRCKKEVKWFDKKECKFRYKDFNDSVELDTFIASLDDNDVIDITVEKYLELPGHIRNKMFIFKSEGINWENKDVEIDPYILGMWLGDDSSSGYAFSTADYELLDKWREWGKENDATIKHHERYMYRISSTINNEQTAINCNKTEKAPLKKLLVKYNLINNKHIPLHYMVNDRETRLKLLAGLIDIDSSVKASGHEIRICKGEMNYQLIHDIEFLARSLGFSCYLNDGMCYDSVKDEKRQKPFKELTITGKDLYEIPTVLPRKKLYKLDNPSLIKQSISRLQSSFKLVKKPIQPFVGWQLEGNGRFLLGDMSVSHNTPEGASVGLVKNLAMTTNITISSNSTNVRELIFDLGTIPFSRSNIQEFDNFTRVIVNGDIMGIHKDPHMLFTELKKLKLSGCINICTGIVWNIIENEISVSTEGGRCVRPLFIANEVTMGGRYDEIMNQNTSWQDILIMSDVIEFLDVEEVNTSLIAMKYTDLFKGGKGNTYPQRYTHLEMHPSLMLGALASCIPFSDHNQAPRNCYQASQGKQALGIYASNFKKRYDTLAHVMNYPQKPLVRTKMSKILNNDNLPCGVNAIVAIMVWTGYNQEDSLVMNQSAIEKGLFTSTYFHTYKEQNNKNYSNGEEEEFRKPDIDTTKISKPYNYDKIKKDGFVPENTFVTTGDVIIGKCMPNRIGNVIHYKDNSVPIKNNESGFIDKNCYNDEHFLNINPEGNTFCKVRTRYERIPTVGDKFSARSAQKGTIGMTYRQEDMPFTKDGIVPDLIMNPHAIPSRMTIGQLMECIIGKACVKLGAYADSTPFNEVNIEDIADILEEYGMERYGNEILYNSRTGEQMMTNIFIGPTFYQRLKHMTADKVHCLTSDHEVLTTRGWIPINDVTTEDMVATLKNGELVYDHPLEVLHFDDYNDKMYHIANSSIDLNVTINHRMWVSTQKNMVWENYTLKKAEDIVGKHVRYQKNAVWNSTEYQFKLPAIDGYDEKVFDMDSWLTFFGIWIAEGWVYNGDTNHVYTTSIDIHKQRVKDVLFDAVKKLGYKYTMNDSKLHISNKQLHSYIKNLSVGALNKYLPDWVWSLSDKQCSKLVYSMCLGYGTFGNGRMMYYTSSTKLADDFMRLCLHSGFSSTKEIHIKKGTISYIDERKVQPNHDIYRLPVIIQKNNPSVNHGHNHRQNVQVEEVYDYQGSVYCLRVPSEVFYVRRNGKSCWTGNSRSSSGPIVLLTRQPAEGRARDGGLRMGEMENECNWAHGIFQFLKERLMECSDNYRVFICKNCGNIAICNPEKNVYCCKNCKNITKFGEVRIPYACKLLFQEIQTMGIGAKFIT